MAKGTLVDAGGIADSPTQRLKALFMARLKRFEERRFARRVCSESLSALQAVQAARPALKGDELYEAVIARRLDLDAANAHARLQRAHESIEDWENERVTKFIDVVKYMIVSEYLGQETQTDGMSIDLGAFLSERIDTQL